VGKGESYGNSREGMVLYICELTNACARALAIEQRGYYGKCGGVFEADVNLRQRGLDAYVTNSTYKAIWP